MKTDSASPSTETKKTRVNFLTAIGLSLLALWMVIADLQYPGDAFFHLSMGFIAFSIGLGMTTFAALLLAVYPKRIIIGANILLFLRGLIGYPLNLWTDNSTASLIVSVSVLALCLYYLVCSARNMINISSRPWTHVPHTLIILGASTILGILSIPTSVLGFVQAFENSVGDYVRFSPKSVSLVERVFTKDNQSVHLVGMMHIGDRNFYKNLEKRLNAPLEKGRKRLVLTEGVSDVDGILPKDFASGKTYERLAKLLGIDTQKKLKTSSPETPPKQTEPQAKKTKPADGVDFKNADIDVGELDPAHQKVLVAILNRLGETNLLKLIQLPEGITSYDCEKLINEGLIGQRNDALMASFEKFGSEYSEIFIPWGAFHLPDIEERLQALGFEEVKEEIRPIISFSR